MSTATEDAVELSVKAEQRANAEEQARIVMGLLKEYAGKLTSLNDEFVQVLSGDIYQLLNQSAWILDQSEILRKPLLTILSRGSGLREISPLEPISRDELSLRMFEVEIHLHHMIRQTNQLREILAQYKLVDQVAKLRMAAGLPGGQNGPPK